MKCPKEAKKPRRMIAKISNKRRLEKAEKSETEMFSEIWAERPHISELSGKPLPYAKGHFMWVRQFLHVLNKGRYKSLRLDKRNILLGTPDEHLTQDRYPAFIERQDELYLEIHNKINQLKK